jgi:hypothetical protein
MNRHNHMLLIIDLSFNSGELRSRQIGTLLTVPPQRGHA